MRRWVLPQKAPQHMPKSKLKIIRNDFNLVVLNRCLKHVVYRSAFPRKEICLSAVVGGLCAERHSYALQHPSFRELSELYKN